MNESEREKKNSNQTETKLQANCPVAALQFDPSTMAQECSSIMSVRSRHSLSLRRSRSLKPIDDPPPPPTDKLLAELLKFRIDGRTINARNVNELYPDLERLLLRCLQTGDCRQLDNRLRRNLKAQYLLITEKHINISVLSQTQDILDRLVGMGATLGK